MFKTLFCFVLMFLGIVFHDANVTFALVFCLMGFFLGIEVGKGNNAKKLYQEVR